MDDLVETWGRSDKLNVAQPARHQAIYYPGLDGLRFFAFVLVLLSHQYQESAPPILRAAGFIGWTGVQLFFALSSFLLTRLAVEETTRLGRVSIKKFYIRRLLRIWPLYFLYAFGYYFFYAVPHHQAMDFLPRLLGLLTFTDNLWSGILHTFNSPLAGHLWSISMEEQFYFLLPLLIPMLIPRTRKTQLILGGSAVGFLLVLRAVASITQQPHPFVNATPLAADSFIFGMLLGLGAFDELLRRVHPLIEMIVALGLLSIVNLFPWVGLPGVGQVITYTIIAVSFTLMVDALANHSNRLLDVVFSNRLARYLGKVSFGLYIWHIIVLHVVAYLVQKMALPVEDQLRWWITTMSTLILTALVATASYELYEKRFLKLKARFTLVTSRPL